MLHTEEENLNERFHDIDFAPPTAAGILFWERLHGQFRLGRNYFGGSTFQRDAKTQR
jgi:hypothetical protein